MKFDITPAYYGSYFVELPEGERFVISQHYDGGYQVETIPATGRLRETYGRMLTFDKALSAIVECAGYTWAGDKQQNSEV